MEAAAPAPEVVVPAAAQAPGEEVRPMQGAAAFKPQAQIPMPSKGVKLAEQAGAKDLPRQAAAQEALEEVTEQDQARQLQDPQEQQEVQE